MNGVFDQAPNIYVSIYISVISVYVRHVRQILDFRKFNSKTLLEILDMMKKLNHIKFYS